jgi:hypothetical protein
MEGLPGLQDTTIELDDDPEDIADALAMEEAAPPEPAPAEAGETDAAETAAAPRDEVAPSELTSTERIRRNLEAARDKAAERGTDAVADREGEGTADVERVEEHAAVDAPAPPPTLLTAADLKKAGRIEQKCGEPHPEIEKVKDHHFVIQRSLIDFYTQSIERLNTLGWSKKYEGEDQKGWYISGFGCKSPLWKGGLRNRDVVQSLNGRKTNNVVQIIAIWATMKKKGAFEIKVWRKGKEVTLHYTVV